MDQEVVVHTHNGMLLSYKKECIWVSSNEVDEPGAYYTEWSKSEIERQILYINAYIWNLERWYQQSYIQGSKGDTDIKNRLLDTVGEGEGGMIWENSLETYIFPYGKQIASGSLIFDAGNPKPVLCENLDARGRREEEGGIKRANSCWCMAITHGQFMLMYGKNHHSIVK